ncbi:adenylosuccinate lyase [Ruficoccus amylovorans]|uniref:Adenylosuccinate lyase n=1 Tax=Ruficoccus amylovorans TaxID=1804625 RepID=A0A842HHM4_9BACT|nr:adenylosuccinate lyase [Ruficoccus amylovorans]MBC2595498.1 adenylosuccinate lyase [Ruficoccus amylovorans]
MESIPNVLADRYASGPMKKIWSPSGRIVLEREFWIAVLKAQADLGLSVPAGAVEAYEAVRDQVNLEAIKKREKITRHDVKARLEEFCDLAGHQQLHKGLTSRDLTENVEQLQVYRSLELVRGKVAAALIALSRKAVETQELPITARTHNVAAQLTTFGKRLTMFGEDLLLAFNRLDSLMKGYPVRGLKGAVGTQTDQLRLFDGDTDKAAALDQAVGKHLGLPAAFDCVGQVYPRSLDFDVVSALYQLACGPASLAKTLRLMAGHELASEGFAPGQTGSSAMPHKMNSRSCERINGFHHILRGHVTMASELGGDQWNEGDVSCSVVRRVVLPDAFFALDGLLETFLTVLRQMEVYPEMTAKENAHYLPFLSTTAVLMEAVKAGVGREEAHEVIKEHALATARDLKAGKISRNDLAERLGADSRLKLGEDKIKAIIDKAKEETGSAVKQVGRFAEKVVPIAELFRTAVEYIPEDIL